MRTLTISSVQPAPRLALALLSYCQNSVFGSIRGSECLLIYGFTLFLLG